MYKKITIGMMEMVTKTFANVCMLGGRLSENKEFRKIRNNDRIKI